MSKYNHRGHGEESFSCLSEKALFEHIEGFSVASAVLSVLLFSKKIMFILPFPRHPILAWRSGGFRNFQGFPAFPRAVLRLWGITL